MFNQGEFQELIGKVILAVNVDIERTYLEFETDDGDFLYYAYGDCCSSSWFESLNGLERLLGQKVVSVVDREMEDAHDEHYGCVTDWDQDCIKHYGWSLVTQQGYFDIEMRNSSNGYYGGHVEFVHPNPDNYEAIDSNTYKSLALRPVKKDF